MKKNNKRSESFLILPYVLVFDTELSLTEKIILAEIISITRVKGYCYASNAYFAKMTEQSERSVSKNISALRDKGYIKIEISDYAKRIIKVVKDNIEKYNISALKKFSHTPEKFSNPLKKFSNPSEKFSNPLENISTYKNNYNNKNNNSYKYNKKQKKRKSSYDLGELMKIE